MKFDSCVVIFSDSVKIVAGNRCKVEINQSILVGCNGTAWEGIVMNSSYNTSEAIIVDSSYFIGAIHPIKTDRTPDIRIDYSVFIGGDIAIELGRSQAFRVSQNLIGGFNYGHVTHDTQNGYTSYIDGNRFIEVEVGAEFTCDFHTDLWITCNEFRYRDAAIRSNNTDLKDQGDTLTGAGNAFMFEGAGLPENYIDHTGSPTTYYFGPMERNQFSYPNVMNIPQVSAVADQACAMAFVHNFGPWLSVDESPESQENTLTVYPNPGNGSFTVSFSDPLEDDYRLYVLDVLGREVMSIRLNNGAKTANFDYMRKEFILLTCEPLTLLSLLNWQYSNLN